MFKIEKKITPPGSRHGVTIYPYAIMGDGDSFLIPSKNEKSAQNLRQAAYFAFTTWQKRTWPAAKDMEIRTSIESRGVRVWLCKVESPKTYKIDTGLPIPAPKLPAKAGETIFPFLLMQPGDSFFVHCDFTEQRRVRDKIKYAWRNIKIDNQRIVTRYITSPQTGIRVWILNKKKRE